VNRPFAFSTLPVLPCLALVASGFVACAANVNIVPVSRATPTTAPSSGAPATPTPPPPGVLSVNPPNMTLIGVGATYAQQIGIVETGYAQGFAVTSTCATIATLAPLTGTGPSLSVTVTGLAPGSCSATVTDANNQSEPVAITVSAAGISLQSLGDGR
jgi:hypothetical protein